MCPPKFLYGALLIDCIDFISCMCPSFARLQENTQIFCFLQDDMSHNLDLGKGPVMGPKLNKVAPNLSLLSLSIASFLLFFCLEMAFSIRPLFKGTISLLCSLPSLI